MADSLAPSPAGDHNLLVAILAFQNNFIGQQELIAALESWSADKSQSIVQVLVEQKKLTPAQQALLHAIAEEHVKRHHRDVQASLAAVSSIFVSRASQVAVGAEVGQEFGERSTGKGIDSTVDRERDLGTSRPGELLATTIRVDPRNPGAAGKSERYQSLHLHAEGGLGMVFVARDEELHREVALKEIKPKYAHELSARQRFVREAEITGGLEHPGIVPVYGLGTYADGRPFYAMRFIRGESLKSAIDDFFTQFALPSAPHILPASAFRSLEFRQLMTRFVAVCNALAYAHARGVIHRDLKPANIMLGKFGETLVVDWGLAKATGVTGEVANETVQSALKTVADIELDETRTGTALGTPPYMSPEQAGGRVSEFNAATDIYLLGSTLYHLLTGRPPHRGHDLDQLRHDIQADEVASPRDHNPAIPAPLAAICQRAMRLKQPERYATSLELAAELERYLADEAVEAYREPVTVRVRRALRKRPALSSALAAAVVVALVGFAIGSGIVGQKNSELRLTNSHLVVATKAARQSAGEAATEAQRANGEASRANLEAARATTEAERANESLRRSREAVFTQQLTRAQADAPYSPAAALALLSDVRLCPLDLRDLSWRIARLQADRLMQTERPFLAPVSSLEFAPTGNGHTLGSLKGDVLIYSDGNAPPIQLKLAAAIGDMAYSPDGKLLAVIIRHGTLGTPQERGSVQIHTVSSGEVVQKLEEFRKRVRTVEFSPKGDLLAIGGDDKQITLVSSRDWKTERVLTGHQIGIQRFAFFSPTQLCSAGVENPGIAAKNKSELLSWDLEQGEPTRVNTGDKTFHLAALCPEQQLAATVGQDNVIRVWRVPSGHLEVEYAGHSSTVLDLEFSRSGKQLASVSHATDGKALETGSGFAGDIRIWNAQEPTRPLVLSGHTLPLFAVGFSTDERTLLTGAMDGSVKRWKLAENFPTAQLAIGPREIRALALSPRRDRLAAVCAVDPEAKDKAAEIVIWDLNQGLVAARWKAHTNQIESLAFAPDGEVLASGSQDNTIAIWNVHSGQRLHELKGHTDMVTGLAFSPDGQHLASGSSDLTVRWWDWRTERSLAVLQGHAKEVSAVAMSSAGDLLASCDYGGVIRLWDAQEQDLVAELRGHGGKLFSSIREVKFSPDGRWLASCGFDEQVLVWDVKKRQLQSRLRGHQGPVYALDFTSDSRTVVSSGTDGRVVLWDVQNGLERLAIKPPVALGITTLAVAKEDSGLFLGDAAGNVHWLHIGGQSVQTTFPGHELPPVMEGQFTPDGKQFVTMGLDRNIRVWNAEDCQSVQTWIAHDAVPSALDISRDSTMVASADMDDQVKIWRLANGELVQQFLGRKKSLFERAVGGVVGGDNVLAGMLSGASFKMINSMAFSPDGKRLAVATTEKTVRIWDPLTGKELQVLADNPAAVFAVFYLSADRLVGGDIEGNVLLWDLTTGKQIAKHALGGQVMSLVVTRAANPIVVGLAKDDAGEIWTLNAELTDPQQMRKRESPVIALSLSRDGRQLAASCLDHSVELCDFPSGKNAVLLRRTLDATIQMGTPVSISPDGDKVISGGPSTDIYLWRRRADNTWVDPVPPLQLFPGLQK